jgi:hypothetical protein
MKLTMTSLDKQKAKTAVGYLARELKASVIPGFHEDPMTGITATMFLAVGTRVPVEITDLGDLGYVATPMRPPLSFTPTYTSSGQRVRLSPSTNKIELLSK